MPKDKKKTIVGLGIGLLGALAYLVLRKPAPPIPPADIVLSDLVIEPSEVYVGETVTISIIVTNIGETVGSYEVTCEVL